MSAPLKITDEQIIEACGRIRQREGACTIEVLARELGVSRRTGYERVGRLLEEGKLRVGPVAGSLRRGNGIPLKRPDPPPVVIEPPGPIAGFDTGITVPAVTIRHESAMERELRLARERDRA